MSASSSDTREAVGRLDRDGVPEFEWRLTDTRLGDLVKLVIPPNDVLPVIFVPGIMGSNLKSNDGKNDLIWRLDAGFKGIPTKIVGRWVGKSAGERQKALHPARAEVDRDGAVPKQKVGSIANLSDYKHRGWGEVGEPSYHEFLLWLEDRLNGQGANPLHWSDFSYTRIESTPSLAPGQPGYRPPTLPPGIPMLMRDMPGGAEIGHHPRPVMSDDLIKRAGFRMPVYACGYNWLDSNEVAAKRLQARIQKVIAENNQKGSRCQQVIVVTHSLGGLVARRCAMLSDMQDSIAGVVHGVMPAVGAAVAYRRCKVGMWDEDKKAGLAIGNDGKKVTAVFAQAPGALQLLPSQEYQKGWLKVVDANGRAVNLQPVNNPYDDIYLRRDRWWGLVREEWLRPEDGRPITWEVCKRNLSYARDFHRVIAKKYHARTYVYYGADRKHLSFEKVTWRMKAGRRPDTRTLSASQVGKLGSSEVQDSGNSPGYVGGDWELHCDLQDSSGDGTVPASSGRAPLIDGGQNIRQQFRLTGFEHEGSYRHTGAQRATLYSIIKIAGDAKASTG